VSLHGSAENHSYHYYKGFILDTCELLHGQMAKFMNWPVIFFHLEALLSSCEVLYIYQTFTTTLYYKQYVTVDYSWLFFEYLCFVVLSKAVFVKFLMPKTHLY